MATGSLTTLTLDELRARRTMKWTTYPPDVLPLWVAEMDFATAPVVQEAIRDAVAREVYGYPSHDGRLAEAVAAFSQRRYGWAVDPACVHVVPDVLKAVELAITHLTTPDSAVVLPVPAYMPFFDVLHLTGRRGVFVPMLREADGYAFDLTAIEAAFAAGAGSVILCNPYNPLGAVFSVAQLRALTDLAASYDALVIADEIHAPLRYEGAHVPAASVSAAAAEVTLTLVASSKGWNTPGLKCAQVITSNPRHQRAWTRMHRLRGHGASTIGIEASIASYEHGEPWLESLLAYLRGNRDYLAAALPQVAPGIGFVPPAATYLAWLDFREVSALGGAEPSPWLVEHARVALNPGVAFGAGGAGHARLNFGTSREILEEYVDRVGRALGTR